MMNTAVMDLPIWFIFATVLLIAVQAGPTDQGPQTFTDNKPAKPAAPEAAAAIEQKQKQHKRAPKYEMQMKEVILYLTPSQIRALESGQGLPKPDTVNQPQPSYEQIKDEMQNVFNEQGQKLQKQVEDLETTRKQKMQSKETPQKESPKKTKEREEKKLSPEHNAPQSPNSELQKREKFIHLPLQFELIPQLQYQNLQSQLIHPEPTVIPQQEQQVYEQQLPEAETQPEGVPQNNEELPPQNYAYLYFYPESKPADQGKLEFFYPNQLKENQKQLVVQPEEPAKDLPIQSEPEAEQPPKELLIQPQFLSKDLVFQPGQLHKELLQLQREQIPKPLFLQPNHLPKPLFDFSAHSPDQFVYRPHEPILPFQHKYRFVPYDYGYANKLEAQQILQEQLENHELESRRPKKPSVEPEQVEEDAQDILARKELEAQYQQFNKARKIEEAQELDKVVQQFQASLEKPKVPKPSLEYLPQPEEVKDIEELKALHKKQMLEVIEAHKLKAQLQAQEQEAHRLDAQLEAEQLKAEKMKEEHQQQQQQLEFLSELEPKRTQMYSILKPLFQGHNIAESLEEKKASFPHHKISLEKGFKPLQYAPKYNNEKYAKEVEKILRKNQVEKEKALAKAAAIANEPPEIITTNEDGVTKHHTAEFVKHLKMPVPTPVFVPVPEPFEVKIPQPYPVPLEIIRPIPIPIVKMEKVEVEKPVPVEVEKHVPVPITKNVYVKVDKPYFVEKVVPVEVKKEIPVEIPIRKHQKLSIIRHVWEH